MEPMLYSVPLDKGTEVVINGENIGIITSNEHVGSKNIKYYSVKTRNSTVRVSEDQIVPCIQWAKNKLLNQSDQHLYWRKMVHKKIGKSYIMLKLYGPKMQ